MRIVNRMGLTVLLVIAMFALLLTGCTDQRTAKEVLQEAYKKQLELNSYSFSGSVKFRANVEGEGLANDPDAAQTQAFLDALQKSELTFKGTTQVDPMQTEVILDAKINFQGMSMNFNMPLIMNQDKMWVKLPAINFIPELAQFQGKYLEIDYQELSEMSNQPFHPAEDIKAQRELGAKVTDIFFKHTGAEFFVDEKKENVKLPEGIQADRIVKLQLTNDNLAAFLKVLLGNVAPEILDAIANSELSAKYNMDKAEIEAAKEELKNGLAQFDKDAAKLKELFSIQKADFVSAIDKDNQVPYSLVDFDVTANVPEEKIKVAFGMTLDIKQSNFNATPKWEVGIPKPEEVVPMKELQGGMTQ